MNAKTEMLIWEKQQIFLGVLLDAKMGRNLYIFYLLKYF